MQMDHRSEGGLAVDHYHYVLSMVKGPQNRVVPPAVAEKICTGYVQVLLAHFVYTNYVILLSKK